MKQDELNEILKFHKMWLNSEQGGKRADLRRSVLTGANLRDADLRDALLIGANLRRSVLTGADLRDAFLTGANLTGADLTGADLRYADLTDANLTGADLRYADLRRSVLRRSVLTGAYLRDCIGNNKEIKSLQIGTYLISYTKDILTIGCQSHTLDKWKAFTDHEISEMDEYALEWWKLNKDIVIELVEREIKG